MGAQAQTPEVTSKKGMGTDIQAPEVTSTALAFCASSSSGLMVVESLVSQALFELVTTYFTETIGPARRGKLNSKMAIALGLNFITVRGLICLPLVGRLAR